MHMATQNKLREGVTFPSFEEADTFIKKLSVAQMSPIITEAHFVVMIEVMGESSMCVLMVLYCPFLAC